VISTVAGTGVAGFSGDGGPGAHARLRQPHSILVDRDGSLLICDIGNHRIRRVDLATSRIVTWAGTWVAQPTPDGAPLAGTPLNGPRTFAFAPDGTLFLALREGNAILRIDTRLRTLHHVAGVGGRNGWTGDGGPAREAQLGGPKGLALDARRSALFIADTETHVIRRVDLRTGGISTVLGNGQRGDGPEDDPLQCKLNRPHGLCVDADVLYVTDSEAHRIRQLSLV
jgi:sugar lactone lactonase YvrE